MRQCGAEGPATGRQNPHDRWRLVSANFHKKKSDLLPRPSSTYAGKNATLNTPGVGGVAHPKLNFKPRGGGGRPSKFEVVCHQLNQGATPCADSLKRRSSASPFIPQMHAEPVVMPITDVELNQLASNVADDHSEAAVALACLVNLSTARFDAHGSAHRAGLSRLHDLGMLCVRTYAQRIGVPWSDVRAAIRALQRSGDTAGYLHRLPD